MKQFAAAKKCLCLANPKTKDPLFPLQWLCVGSAGDFFMLLIRPCPLKTTDLLLLRISIWAIHLLGLCVCSFLVPTRLGWGIISRIILAMTTAGKTG
jgi:hypothetical protein